MTIIITAVDRFGHLAIVTDNAELRRGEAFTVDKVYQSADGKLVWSCAGYPPSRAMVRAKAVEDLWEATKEWCLANPSNQLLLIETATEENPVKVWVSYTESPNSPSSLVEVAGWEVAIGGFADTWPAFKRKFLREHPDADDLEAAYVFARTVNELSGLTFDCFSEIVGTIPEDKD